MPEFLSITQDFQNFVLSDADTSMGLGDTAYIDQLSDPSLNHLKQNTAQAKKLLRFNDNQVTAFEMKLKEDVNAHTFAEEMQKELGNDFREQTTIRS